MRKFPIVNGNIRKISQDIVVSGYQIPANIHVAVATNMQLKNPKQFYQPDDYIPERWLRVEKEEAAKCPHARSTHDPFTYIPFGFGARMCIGKRLAELEVESLISRIVRNYKLEWHHEDMKTKDYFINLPISEMKFKVIDVEH
jgi:cytochrome P450 family 12